MPVYYSIHPHAVISYYYSPINKRRGRPFSLSLYLSRCMSLLGITTISCIEMHLLCRRFDRGASSIQPAAGARGGDRAMARVQRIRVLRGPLFHSSARSGGCGGLRAKLR